MFSCDYCQIFKNNFFIDNLWWLLLNFFTEFQKETIFSINDSVMKTFRCSLPIDFAFKMSIQCSERTTQSEKMFFIIDFLVVTIYQNFLFVYTRKFIQNIWLLLVLISFCFYSLSLFLLFYSPLA